MGKHSIKRNYEFRIIPGVDLNIKVSRDGEIQENGRPNYYMGLITDLNGTKMTIQMAIHKAFPDIPLRHTPKW